MKSRTNALTLLALLVAGSFTALSPASADTIFSSNHGPYSTYRSSVLNGSVYGTGPFLDGYSEPLDWGTYYSPFGNAGDFAGNAQVMGPTRGFFERMFDKDEHRTLQHAVLVPACPQACD